MKSLVITFLSLVVSVQSFAQSLELRGKLDAVTVYRGQAMVTRVVEVPAPGGSREVVVTDLPAKVVGGSIFAESANGTQVRSVLYRERPVAQDVREDVRKIDESIKGLQDEIAANQRNLVLLNEQKAYLAKLEQFVAPTAQHELTRGVLNAETLKSLTGFVFEQHKGVAAEELKLGREARELAEKMNLLQRQRQELTKGSSKTVREAVLFVNLPPQGGKIRVGYLVEDATWEPSYNVRADAERKNVNVEYNASVQQQSGEDWTDVMMTLSTASPTLLAKAPSLTPLTVALTAPGQQQAQSFSLGANYQEARKNFKAQRDVEEQNRSRFGINNSVQQQVAPAQVKIDGIAVNAEDVNLNKLAGELQVLELLAKDTRLKEDDAKSKPEEGVSVNYELASRTSLPSRSDRQLIQIASMPMKGEFYKVAIPVLTNYVYDEAEITNDSKQVLLAGPMMTYVGGQFVGHSAVPTVAVGQTFTVGFGIDSSMRAGRELVDKTETVQGGNRLLNFTYRLNIENFGSAPAKVRLMERMPTAKETEVKVTLVSTGSELSKEEAYQQTERKKGILRWDVEVPAQARGTKAFTMDYRLGVEFDKQMSIAGIAAAK